MLVAGDEAIDQIAPADEHKENYELLESGWLHARGASDVDLL